MESRADVEYYSKEDEEVVDRSEFDGDGWDYFRISLLRFLICFFTLGIGTPWALCMMERWRLENTVIEGQEVEFDGTGNKLFWHYIWWSFLSVITLGVYGFWKYVKIREWMVAHTHLV